MADNPRSKNYHEDRSRDSHSTLEIFRESPVKYKAMFIDKTLEKKETAAMEIGSAFHTFLLEPAEFHNRYAIAPERWKQNTNAGKDALAKFLIDHVGKTVLWPEEFQQVEDMAGAVMANDETADLIFEETPPENIERIIEWEDEASGLAMRSMIDKLIEKPDRLIVVDLKSVDDPSIAGFGKAAANFAYHRQEAMYRQAVSSIGKPVEFWFLVSGKAKPYEAGLYCMAADDVAMGHRQNLALMSELAEAKLFNKFVSRIGGRRNVVKLPRYAYFQD